LSEAASQVNQRFPALSISYLTVAKRLYLMVWGFFSPVFGGFNRAHKRPKMGSEQPFHR
jgi:hypothetical protein